MHSRRTVLVVGVACTMPDEGRTQTRGDGLGGEGEMAREAAQAGLKGVRRSRQGNSVQEAPSWRCLRYVGSGFSDHF